MPVTWWKPRRTAPKRSHKILEGQYQILLTDWDMPGMDGPTLCKRVREANLSTYVYILLLTGHLTTDDVVVGLGAGADDYVKKPANQAELLARLSAGSRIVTLEQSLREANEKIQLLSVTDSLAGTFNRRYLNDQLLKEVERARRYGHSLAAIMADLDRFKRINDERGHQTGDEVLRRFADLAKKLIRPSDWIARYGGEEFVIVLPETDAAGAVVRGGEDSRRMRRRPDAAGVGRPAGDIELWCRGAVARHADCGRRGGRDASRSRRRALQQQARRPQPRDRCRPLPAIGYLRRPEPLPQVRPAGRKKRRAAQAAGDFFQ